MSNDRDKDKFIAINSEIPFVKRESTINIYE